MNWRQDIKGESSEPDLQLDSELDQALKHFKASVDAWSDAMSSDAMSSDARSSHAMSTEAAYSRSRPVTQATVRHTWRMAAGWALGCVVVLGSLAGAVRVAVHEIVQRQQAARAAAQKVEQKTAEDRTAAAPVTPEPASVQPGNSQSNRKTAPATIRKVSGGAQDNARTQDEDLLASVDSDVSRGVPSAMEPLAQLMDGSGTQ